MDISAEGKAASSGSMSIEIQRFYDKFLELARRITEDPEAGAPEYAVAVVVAATACEVAGERAMDALLTARVPTGLADIIRGCKPKFTFFGDKRLLELWTFLTGDQIQKSAFWPHYAEHVKRRNNAVHTGMNQHLLLDKAAAEDSLAVASVFITHLRKTLTASGLASYA